MTNYPPTFELPTKDQLTNLLSSAYFRHLLREDLLKNAAKEEEPLSLFLLDSDNFAEINTTYGHEAGDRVLVTIGKVLQEVLPDAAVITRYGGDEFGAALPDTRLDDAFTLLEEVRRRIAAIHFDDYPGITLSCSIGLAAYPTHGDNDVELMREADQALYSAKNTGRNKIALPLADSRMVTKTSHYTRTQLDRLAALAQTLKRRDASLLREALDDLLKKYGDKNTTRLRE